MENVRKGRDVPHAALTRIGRRLPIRDRGAAVLCYHDIGTDGTNTTDYYVSPDRFRTQLEGIREWGFTFVPFAEIVDRLLAGRDLDGLVAVTFDDALVGVGHAAAPILAALRIPATIFVVTDVLGIDPPFWSGAARTLTADELTALAATGLITLGSHTCTHASLPDVADEVRARELRDSRVALTALGAAPTDLLAYPSGHHNTETETAAAAAGYRAACTFSFGRVTSTTDPYAIPRFCMHAGQTPFHLARLLARRPTDWQRPLGTDGVTPPE